jgi:hypothetical protein
MRCLFVLALALLLPACTPTSGGLYTPSGAPSDAAAGSQISIVYRDDATNERTLNGVIRYNGVMGRDRAVPFTVKNQSDETACEGTFTRAGPNGGNFSMSCFGGVFTARGTYERRPGDPDDRFIARGQTSRGFPIVLFVGRQPGR